MHIHELIFSAFNDWVMFALCLTLSFTHIITWAYNRDDLRSKRKLAKTFNYIVLGAAFLWPEISNPSVDDYRGLLRFTLALVLMGEIAYHSYEVMIYMNEIARTIIGMVKGDK